MNILKFYLKKKPSAEVRWRLEDSRFGVGRGNLPDSERRLVLFMRYGLSCESGAKDANVGIWLLKLGYCWIDGWT